MTVPLKNPNWTDQQKKEMAKILPNKLRQNNRSSYFLLPFSWLRQGVSKFHSDSWVPRFHPGFQHQWFQFFPPFREPWCLRFSQTAGRASSFTILALECCKKTFRAALFLQITCNKCEIYSVLKYPCQWWLRAVFHPTDAVQGVSRMHGARESSGGLGAFEGNRFQAVFSKLSSKGKGIWCDNA